MSNELRFDGRVAVITGAGNGLGRSHALLLARRGCKVVVNDLGGSAHGSGQSSAAADKVVEEIKALGGTAVANYDSVENGDKIIKTALDAFGRVDIVVNNAGILRDTSFPKMTSDDWELIQRVHVLGAFRVTHAAWNVMRDAGYGRILFTSSAAGIYGNFGQANYATAKLGLVGFANALAIEGRKRNIRVNAIAPIAGSRMTETVLPKEMVDALKPEYVSPLVAWLAHESCEESGALFEVGGGFYAKLRWERSAGATFPVGRDITPEQIASAAGAITSFEKSEHPEDITSSMQPVLDNLNRKSKGGNEFINVDLALGHTFKPFNSSYTERDLAVYALAVGASRDPLDTSDLRYVYEMHGDGFQALPTYAVIPAVNGMLDQAKQGETAPGLNYGFERILHGEQFCEIKRPLPPNATLTHKSRVKDIWDKGKHALVVVETRSYDSAGEEIIYNEATMFVRGAGGWGGERGPSTEINLPPDRKPDAVIEEKTHENQALLFRLAGDWNPLHADPDFARNFGFPRPILHGLCTFGFAGRHVLRAFCNNDPRKFRSIKARFADSVFPGETLVTEMWKESDTRIVFRTSVKERGKAAISNAAIELYAEIPKEKAPVSAAPPASVSVAAPAPAASPGPTPAASSADADAITSADVFAVIRDFVEKNPDMVKQTSTVFQFKLKSPDSAWALDLKNGAGSVTPGMIDKADCTLELLDSDFMAMTSGKADPQKLFFEKKLKISGNLMASQKLFFLKKIDANAARDAVMKARQAGGAQAAAASSGSSGSGGAATDAIVKALEERIARDAGIAGEVGAAIQFVIESPDASFALDLRSGPGSVKQGTLADASATLRMSAEDLAALAGGETIKSLYQHGRVRVDGDVRVAHKLGFFKGLLAAK